MVKKDGLEMLLWEMLLFGHKIVLTATEFKLSQLKKDLQVFSQKKLKENGL